MGFEFWHRCPECLNAQWWKVAEPNHACTWEGEENGAGKMTFVGCGHVPGARWIALRASQNHKWNGDVATLVKLAPKMPAAPKGAVPAKPAEGKRRMSAMEKAASDRAQNKEAASKPSGSQMKKAARRKTQDPAGQQEDVGE
jgi:hypothetical protein